MRNLWREEEAAGLADLDLLVYRSRLIGRDPDLVLTGGGNTSLKRIETDLLGRDLRVLRVKGSGSDLRVAEPRDFPGLRLDDLLPLLDRDSLDDEAMVAWLGRCLVDPGSPRPSIETLLHAFLPQAHVDHTHADAVLSLTDTPDPRRHVEAAYGREAVLVPYRRPGFGLAADVARAVKESAGARCAILEKHGLVTWGPTARGCYEATLEMAERAAAYVREAARGRVALGALVRPPLAPEARRRLAARLAPRIRGALARAGRPASPDAAAARLVLRYDDGEDILDFAGRASARAAAAAGPATPDHLMYTRLRPLFVDAADADPGTGEDSGTVDGILARAVGDYAASSEERARRHGGEGAVDPRPRIVLVPGVGMFSAWSDARRARLAGEVYHHAIAVVRGAEALGGFRSLSPREAHDIETWPLELYRMSLAPPPPELAGRVALVTGSARGIGRAIALRLAAAGCHVLATDLRREAVEAVAAEIAGRHGPDRARGLILDVTDEASVEAAFDEAARAYGGIDVLVSNAGIAHVSPIDRMDLRDWRRSFEVNATGHFLVARAAVRMLRAQGTGGSLIFVASKNVLAPGKDFGAYSASKAAQAQLARILAIEGGPIGIRVNLIHPDAVFQDSGLWSPQVREERARAHGIRPEEIEEFYRRRNLLSARVTAEDVAEAALFFASERSARTTGCILTVDGGVREAFPR